MTDNDKFSIESALDSAKQLVDGVLNSVDADAVFTEGHGIAEILEPKTKPAEPVDPVEPDEDADEDEDEDFFDGDDADLDDESAAPAADEK